MKKRNRKKRVRSAGAGKRSPQKSKLGAPAMASYRPEKIPGNRRARETKKTDGSGPLEWILPMMTETYAPLTVREGGPEAMGRVAPGPRPTREAKAAPAVWRNVLTEYKQRKAGAVSPPVARVAAPAPFVPGGRNWLPLGPSIVMDGQTVSNQPVAGRVAKLAVAAEGSIVYAATANGGVFCSLDGGTTWRALMDRFDLNPTSFASASLVCGAIALDRADPNRVYVGTGEGDTLQYFRMRVTGSLPAYRGVGVLRTDDGGKNWVTEPSSPDLAGEAFFALAVDPHNRENVIGATTVGLYRRVQAAGGQAQWTQVRSGVYSSVVAVSNGAGTRFFCAEWGQDGKPSKVLHSDDGGGSWAGTGSGFPSANVGRIALGVQAENPGLVYAFAATSNGSLAGVFRLDGITQAWKRVSAVPDVLPGSQGSYDLTIAVDPEDAALIYLGGDRMDAPPWGGSIWRCKVKASGSAYRVSKSASIGTHAHADVHHICHTPGEPNELWCACDGGVFLNRNPRGTGEFVGQNNGLACLCCNFIAQHPTDPNILFTGLQDNGTARTASGPIWNRVGHGDGGYCLINWADPNRVLIYMNGTVWRSTTGGTSQAGWARVWNFGWATMTQPIVGLPHDPSHPSQAQIVAIGAGPLVYVSNDFAGSWPATLQVPGSNPGEIFALAFASAQRLFMGTTLGQVFRADLGGGTWSLTRIDNVAAGPLGIEGMITDVAVDWADNTLRSIFVAFGGLGDRRRVWHFDGNRWGARSGSGNRQLLDVEHNALAVDRTSPNHIYVGADIGVWHSADSGANWDPLENGLPDAPVYDLQIHPTQRLLRAATHGRGVYEITL